MPHVDDPDGIRTRTLTVYEFTLRLITPPGLSEVEAIAWAKNSPASIGFARASTSHASAVAGAIRDLKAAGIEAEEVEDE